MNVRTLFVFEERKNLTFFYQFTTDLFLRSTCNKLIDLLWLIFHISPSSNYYFQLLQHYCQYVENGMRLISIATASRISALQTPHWHAALWLLHNRRPFFYPTVPCICIHRATGNSIILYIFSLAQKVKLSGNHRNRCRRIISCTISCWIAWMARRAVKFTAK